MKKVELITRTKYYIACPHCGKETFSIGHLLDDKWEGEFGIWYCNDRDDDSEIIGCGKGIKGKVIVKTKEVFIEKSDKYITSCLVLLKHKNLALIVEHFYFDGNSNGLEYIFNEHTCPSNFIGRNINSHIIDITHLDEGYIDVDEHGIFEYIDYVDFPMDKNGKKLECNDLDDYIHKWLLEYSDKTFIEET